MGTFVQSPIIDPHRKLKKIDKNVSRTMEVAEVMDAKNSTLKVNSFMAQTIDKFQEDERPNAASSNDQFNKRTFETVDGPTAKTLVDSVHSPDLSSKIESNELKPRLIKTQGSAWSPMSP